jgi:hypothetical protein
MLPQQLSVDAINAFLPYKLEFLLEILMVKTRCRMAVLIALISFPLVSMWKRYIFTSLDSNSNTNSNSNTVAAFMKVGL